MSQLKPPTANISRLWYSKHAWRKSQQRYAMETVMDRLNLPNIFLNTKYDKELDMGDHVSIMESQFAQLVVMGSTVDESMRLAFLIYPLNNQTVYELVISFIRTLGKRRTTWDDVSAIVVEKQNRLRNKSTRGSGDALKEGGNNNSTVRRNIHTSTSKRRSSLNNIHC